MHPSPPYPGGPYPAAPGWPPPVGPNVAWAVGLWVLAGLTAIGTSLCALGTAYGFWLVHHMAEEGVTTTAVVTRADGADVTVEYTAQGRGRTVTELTWWSGDEPTTGDEVEVTYDPDDVTYAVAAGSDEDRYLAIGFAVATGIGLMVLSGASVGAVLVHRARSRNARAARPPTAW